MPRWRNLLAAVALTASACTPRHPAPVAPAPEPAPTPPPAVVEAPAPAPARARVESPVRVGIAVDTAAVELASAGGLQLSRGDGAPIDVAPGARVTFTAAGDGRINLRSVAGDGTPAAGESGIAGPITVRAGGDGFITLRGTPYRGAILVQRGAKRGLTAVNRLDMEDYLLGVVPREIGKVGPELHETSKAQAVAARTYAVKYLGRRAAQGFDVYATVEDQVYGGVAAEHEPVSRAVRETEGEILTYAGQPIEAYYHSTCAGRTAAIEEVWNQQPVPYLRSITDVDPAGEAYDRSSSRFRWTERWTGPQILGILNRTLADSLPRGVRAIGEVRDLRVLERTPSGRVRRMRITTDVGNFTVGKDRVRWILLTPRGAVLNSSKFDVRVVRDAGGRVAEVVAEGGGWGHGIGMCQVGAMGRARAGQDYRTILQAYYPGTQFRTIY